ncbi:hypothetical protein ACFYZ8_33225 [Streptomyces sp. NPDC001668]|uniref:hypothetical protein n=1 Tax=Streptomyces sp. NPDC001668 TaxID=3364598 RepID=UPI00369D3229
MSAGFAGDVDKAIETYAAYQEAQADKLDRLADACANGEGYFAAYSPAERDTRAQELRQNAQANRNTAAANRTPEGREHLRTTGLWLPG